MGSFRLTVEGRTFRDPAGREVTIRGINVAGDAKFPRQPNIPSHVSDGFFEGDSVSFVGRPFSVDEAHEHFVRLRSWGYNTLRYIFTWEAIEHAGPGRYDDDWIQHTIAVLRIAKEYGFHVFLDPHQDVWSRFSGGCGAPLWTLYACGLDPRGFADTEAAIVHNTYPEPAEFPKMIWSTNYYRMVCQVTFTLFFGGRDFAPKAIIDGKNIQDYLQEHFVGACQYLAKKIHEAGDLEDTPVIGWESMNEPNRGLIGYPDLSSIPSEQKLQKGTSPTAWQGMLTGSGRPCEIETWEFGQMGPYRSGSRLVDPRGTSAWLSPDFDDTRYGWKRDPDWKLGRCIWAQHGVWDPESDTLLRKDYFAKDPHTGELLDYDRFTNTYFMDFYRRYRDAIRSVHPSAILFCQPPVLEIPPTVKGTEDDDPHMVYAPHYYDGLTLMTKSWNRYWNVDVLGVLRGRYLTPAFAIKLGETAIRNCFRDQLAAIRQEGLDHLGEHPCILGEFGIPFDMNDQHAYKSGDYSSQCHALDANHYAVEGSGMNGFTLWLYAATNNHRWGDHWNGEDLSIYSVDDGVLPTTMDPSQIPGKASPASRAPITPSNLKANLSTPSMASDSTAVETESKPTPGYRAAEAFVRPSPITTAGDVQSYGFDLKGCTFSLTLTAATASTPDYPTEIFLPEFHFPNGVTEVEVSGGRWTIGVDDSAETPIQTLKWWHAEGEQSIKVKGVVRPIGNAGIIDEDGYLNQYWQGTCSVM
ncbi:MAG: oxidation resistance protein 1 [Watsoniomyces obsoletus]|nr:MAG: oxidation resistance protein 1 [Watsoniomyces obsoletus]